MKLWNATKDSIAVENLEIAESFGSRLTGLLGRSELPEGTALLLIDTKSIHMFFMRFAIDAVFLDDAMQVVKIVPELGVWRTAACREAKHTLELPAGAAAKAGIEIGDVLKKVNEQQEARVG